MWSDGSPRTRPEPAGGVGAVPLMATTYDLAQQRLARGVTGTMYKAPGSAEQVIEYLLTQ